MTDCSAALILSEGNCPGRAGKKLTPVRAGPAVMIEATKISFGLLGQRTTTNKLQKPLRTWVQQLAQLAYCLVMAHMYYHADPTQTCSEPNERIQAWEHLYQV